MNIIKMNKKNDELNFEDSLMRLEQIAELLENENTSLEESISLFEEGIALKEISDQKLKKAKLKIEKIIKSKNTITTEDFE